MNTHRTLAHRLSGPIAVLAAAVVHRPPGARHRPLGRHVYGAQPGDGA